MPEKAEHIKLKCMYKITAAVFLLLYYLFAIRLAFLQLIDLLLQYKAYNPNLFLYLLNWFLFMRVLYLSKMFYTCARIAVCGRAISPLSEGARKSWQPFS